MANKELTARVKLNISDAERKLNKLSVKINNINKIVNKSANKNGLESTFNRANREAEQLNIKWQKAHPILTRIGSLINNNATDTRKWGEQQLVFLSSLTKSQTALGRVWTKLKGILGTYLTLSAAIKSTDTIIAAKNKLNYVGSQQLGDKGYSADGSYSQATFSATQDALDKMYNSSQKVRMGYSDMMANVSKSMVLASDAFGGSTDNAIRFQEIMAETYAIGGASATEMSTSMYQLIQALGAGTLAGDELRSVREGAPLAYKTIENFVQKIYKTDESLKDLASQGKVTADMVTEAMLNAGDDIDKAFAKTEQTFDQTWTQIKNSVLKSFEPIADKLSAILNSAIDNGLIDKVEIICTTIGNHVLNLVEFIIQSISWIVDNWDWLQHIVYTGIILYISWEILRTAISIACTISRMKAQLQEHALMLKYIGILFVIIAVVVGLIYIFYQWKNGAIDTCNAIFAALMLVAVGLFIIGLLTGNIVLIVVAVVLAITALIMKFLDYIVASAYWLGAVIENIGIGIANGAIWLGNQVVGVANWIKAVAYNTIAGIVNVATALWNSLDAICKNIGIAFENCWIWAQNAFWGFIGGVLEGIRWLEPAINAIAQVFGQEGFTLSGVIDDVSSKQQKYKDYVDVGAAWNSGMNTMQYQDPTKAYNSGTNTFGYMDYVDTGEAWDKGFKVGSDAMDSINQWGSQFQNSQSGLDNLMQQATLTNEEINSAINGLNKTSLPDAMKNLLTKGLSNGKSPEGVADAYNPKTEEELLSGVDNLNNGVNDIKDSIDLSRDDLDYLRKIAEMEWKNEFTTAEIKIDMTNNNMVTAERDLDGIVEYLSDTLRAEMTNVAYGVHY